MNMQFYYNLIYFIIWPTVNLIHPTRTIGRENIPEGNVVICGNHTSLLDPVMMCFALTRKRRMRPMAKMELRKIPLVGSLLERGGAIFVDRGGADLKAIKTAMGHLKEGGRLLLFPEGTRVREGREVEPKGGAALLATRTNSPLLPIYIPKKKPWFRFTTIIVGEPYYPVIAGRKATAEELVLITEELMARIYALGEK